VKTVADRYRHAAQQALMMGFLDLSTSMTLNDLEPLDFFQFLAAAHILIVNCNEMLEDGPRQPACENFSIKRRF